MKRAVCFIGGPSCRAAPRPGLPAELREGSRREVRSRLPPGSRPPGPPRPAWPQDLTCPAGPRGAGGRRGAQPQPEVQRGPEHTRAQQHQPVSHWPPPPAPPRTPAALRVLPRPGREPASREAECRRPTPAIRLQGRPPSRPTPSRFLSASGPAPQLPQTTSGSNSAGRSPAPSAWPPLAPPTFSSHSPRPLPSRPLPLSSASRELKSRSGIKPGVPQ